MSIPCHVYILTCCTNAEEIYGSTMIFRTLRTGFPNAIVEVIDNASVAPAREEVRRQAASCGARFVQLQKRIRHHQFLERSIASQPEGDVVILDPDLCFWEEVESWHFEGLFGGRYIPKHRCEVTASITHPRLHTSFLWIRDVKTFRATIRKLHASQLNVHLLAPIMLAIDGEWHRWDTAAGLYGALHAHAYCFGEKELSAYDHLFCGSHLSFVNAFAKGSMQEKLAAIHANVQSDYRTLRGAWKIQDAYFAERARLVLPAKHA